MDPLAHVFLPLVVCYAVRPDLFSRPRHFALAGFGLLPDFDKFLGMQALLHSLPTLLALTLAVLAVGRYRDEWWVYAVLAVGFLWSHILLDLLDGNVVPWFYPLLRQGYGVHFPMRIAFGEGLLGARLEGWPVAVHTGVPREGHQTFPLFNGYGVGAALAFLAVYAGRHRWSGVDPDTGS